ncbi:MAG: TonB-dependent receptor [Flavobacteriales bacterium]|nr:TonB-dependent receptor [Flavobacteriales bacterium]
MRRLFFLGIALSCFSVLKAQQPLLLEEVEVTASRISQNIEDTGRSVEVIDLAILEKMPVNSVDELLRYVGGVNINSRNGFGVQTDIGLRGSTFSQVLILIDNVRFNDPLTGHFNNNFPIAIADIHQIEIIRGPAASSYGADAVGGVIHIKTKTYVQKGPGTKNEASVDLSYGDHNLFATDAGFILNSKKSSFSASFRSNNSDGEVLDDPNFEAGTSENETYENYFDMYTASLSFSTFLKDSLKLYARASYDDRSFKAKYFYTQSSFDDSSEKTSNAWSQLSLISKKANNDVQLDLGYRRSTDYFEFNPLFQANEHTMDQLFSNVTYEKKMGSSAVVSLGGQFLMKKVESTDRGDHQNSVFGLFALLSKEWKAGFRSNFGLRMEHDENFGTEILPQVSVSYGVGDITLRTSYGRSVRAADFTERFVSYNIPSLSPGRNAGNPDLKAERANSIDLGIDFEKNAFDLSASVFYRASSNVIDFSLTPSSEIDNLDNLQDSADYFYASNIAKTEVLGFELSVGTGHHISENVEMKTQLAYTFLETTGVEAELSKYISDHPSHNVAASISIFSNKWNVDLNGNYIERDPSLNEGVDGNIKENYFVANAKLGYNVMDNISLYTKLFNVTDTQYQEILGAPMPGRWWSLGVKWEL